MPKRIQLQRTKGWRMPPNTLKVDRSTQWGNPFAVWRDEDEGWMVSDVCCHWPVPNKQAGIELAVQKFREQITARLAAEIYPPWVVLHELRGKDLACWCKPGSPCHADVLLELANAPQGCGDAYTGVRCECVLTNCRPPMRGPRCPHYSEHCRKHIAHADSEKATDTFPREAQTPAP